MTDKPDGFNRGGMVHGINDPTFLEGLSRGEFTAKAADVARHGPDLMAKLNALARPKMTLVIGDERHEGLTADPTIMARLEKHAIAQQAFSKITTTPSTSWTDDAKAERVAQAIKDASAEKSPGEHRTLGYYAGVGIDHLRHADSPDTYEQLTNALFEAAARAAIAAMKDTNWTDDAKAELHLLALNLHNLSFEVAEISGMDRRRPCLSKILEGYAIRIDELMKRAPEAVP